MEVLAVMRGLSVVLCVLGGSWLLYKLFGFGKADLTVVEQWRRLLNDDEAARSGE